MLPVDLPGMSLADHLLTCLALAVWGSLVLLLFCALALTAFRIGEALGFKAE